MTAQLTLPGLLVPVRPRRRPRRVADLAREFDALRDTMGRFEQRHARSLAVLQGQIEDLRHRLADVERAQGIADLHRAPARRGELRRFAGSRV